MKKEQLKKLFIALLTLRGIYENTKELDALIRELIHHMQSLHYDYDFDFLRLVYETAKLIEHDDNKYLCMTTADGKLLDKSRINFTRLYINICSFLKTQKSVSL